jgi:transposase
VCVHHFVDLLPWPAVSSDLSPIEHVWDEMERRLRHLPNQPVTLAEMDPALIRIWNNIPQAFFNTNGVLPCAVMPPHTITLPPPND